MDKNNIKVIVLGKKYLTPLTVIRSLGKAGYQTDAFLVMKKEDEIDVVRSSVYTGKCLTLEERNEEKIINLLVEEYLEDSSEKVLFPTDDFPASLIGRYEKQLSELFLMPHIDGMTITAAMDKSNQAGAAAECGLNAARAWIIDLAADTIRIPEDIVYPCFVKPLISAEGRKSELIKCDDENALQTRLRKMQNNNKNRGVLVQEFLNIICEYTIGGVCCGQDVFMPAVIRKSRVAQHNRGVTLSGTMADVSELSEISEKITDFLKRMHFTGMFDLEIMKTDRGYYFGELNLRSDGPSYAYFKCGVNLPDITVKAVVSHALQVPEYEMNIGRHFYK